MLFRGGLVHGCNAHCRSGASFSDMLHICSFEHFNCSLLEVQAYGLFVFLISLLMSCCYNVTHVHRNFPLGSFQPSSLVFFHCILLSSTGYEPWVSLTWSHFWADFICLLPIPHYSPMGPSWSPSPVRASQSTSVSVGGTSTYWAPLLSGTENWRTWKIWMEDLLVEAELWDTVSTAPVTILVTRTYHFSLCFLSSCCVCQLVRLFSPLLSCPFACNSISQYYTMPSSII
jgi:hypothetical protein